MTGVILTMQLFVLLSTIIAARRLVDGWQARRHGRLLLVFLRLCMYVSTLEGRFE